jgi:cysteinyl-tRNA synthetase
MSPGEIIVDTGGAIRLALLMSHYRSPLDLGRADNGRYEKVEMARRVLRRFALACEPCDDPVPQEIIDALNEDLNTPKAIAILHGYRKRREGRKLYASLHFLGFFGG